MAIFSKPKTYFLGPSRRPRHSGVPPTKPPLTSQDRGRNKERPSASQRKSSFLHNRILYYLSSIIFRLAIILKHAFYIFSACVIIYSSFCFTSIIPACLRSYNANCKLYHRTFHATHYASHFLKRLQSTTAQHASMAMHHTVR